MLANIRRRKRAPTFAVGSFAFDHGLPCYEAFQGRPDALAPCEFVEFLQNCRAVSSPHVNAR